MILTLVKKEWTRKIKEVFNATKSNILGTLINFLIAGGLFAVVIYVFITLNVRFITYGVSDKLLMFFVGCAIVLYSLVTTNLINKNLYDSKDLTFVLSSPIRKREIVISKYLSFYLYEFISMFPIMFTLFISFGVTNNCDALFYVISTIALFISPIFVLFIGSVLSLPYHYLCILLKNYSIIQLILSLLLVAGFAYLYNHVLNLFIDLINDGRLSYLFNKSNLDILDNINKTFVLGYLLVNTALNHDLFFNLPLLISIFIVSGVFSVAVLIIYYRQIRKHYSNDSYKRFNKKVIVTNPKIALVQKEFVTFFRNSNYLFVYCTFLLSLGFINYAICSSLKVLVARFLGTAFTFFPFALLILSLFASIINGIGANVISKEKRSAIWLKTMPISYKKQVGLKYSILIFMMGISLLISCLMLGIGNILPWVEVAATFVSTFFIVGSILTMIVKKDMVSPNFSFNEKDDNRVNYSLILSFVIPVVFTLLSILVFYFLNSLFMLLTISTLSVLFFILFVNGLIKNSSKKIQTMEVSL